MGKLSIKVVIAGRNYPLTVNEEEAEKVKTAAATINNSIKRLQESYAVKDMQDLLAMTALQLATKEGNNSVTQSQENSSQWQEILSQLKLLSSSIDEQ